MEELIGKRSFTEDNNDLSSLAHAGLLADGLRLLVLLNPLDELRDVGSKSVALRNDERIRSEIRGGPDVGLVVGGDLGTDGLEGALNLGDSGVVGLSGSQGEGEA